MVDRSGLWVEALDGGWSGPLRLRVRGRSMWPSLRPGDQVTVEPISLGSLRAGDWVVVREREGLILHRFLGLTRDGFLLTKGDGLRRPDPARSPDDLLWRAVALSREGRTIPVSSTALRERTRTTLHRLVATTWSLLRRVGLLILFVALVPAIVNAAVTLVSFEATGEAQVIRITWETASEVDTLAFYVKRSLQESGEYQPISEIIPAMGDVVGAYYEHTDASVEIGTTYYYELEAMDTSGGSELFGPISATLLLPTTDTPTPTLTPTSTPTSTSNGTRRPPSTPVPTFTSTPYEPGQAAIEFWVDRAIGVGPFGSDPDSSSCPGQLLRSYISDPKGPNGKFMNSTPPLLGPQPRILGRSI